MSLTWLYSFMEKKIGRKIVKARSRRVRVQLNPLPRLNIMKLFFTLNVYSTDECLFMVKCLNNQYTNIYLSYWFTKLQSHITHLCKTQPLFLRLCNIQNSSSIYQIHVLCLHAMIKRHRHIINGQNTGYSVLNIVGA